MTVRNRGTVSLVVPRLPAVDDKAGKGGMDRFTRTLQAKPHGRSGSTLAEKGGCGGCDWLWSHQHDSATRMAENAKSFA